MEEELYYLEPVSRDHFHLYNPLVHKCRRASLRGGLKRGPKKVISLRLGEKVLAKKVLGSKKWLITDRTRETYEQIIKRHDMLEECDFTD